MRENPRVNRTRRLVAGCNRSELDRRRWRSLLDKAGYACAMYEHPMEMIDNLNVAVPRVIMVDADEYGVGRFKLFTLIRDRHPDLAAPIMVLTESTDRNDLIRARDAGAQDYLIKPVSPETMIRRLDHWAGVRIPCAAAAYPQFA